MTLTDIHPLRNKGFLRLDYPEVLRKSVEDAVNSWKNFCALPQPQKDAFTFIEDSRGDGAGYELKAEKESKKDLKENFHITLHQYSRLSQIANNQTLSFLHNAKILIDTMEPLILEFAKHIENVYDVEGFVNEVMQSKSYWILRYLHYFGEQNTGDEIAAPHADKGGFTLHLYESDEGLQYYCMHQQSWKPMQINKKQTVIIPAVQLQLKTKGVLKALYHRVIATERPSHQGRFSMVCFIPLQKTPMYNKKVYGNMQCHEVGFNYGLSHEIFEKLFS